MSAPVHRRRLSRLETAFIARRNVLEIIPSYAYRQPIVSGDILVRWHMLADPAGMKRVMLDNLANYPKSEIMRRMLRPAIGESLFNADGADWKWQRQAVAPVFTHRNVVALAPAMSATAARAAERLARCGGRAELVKEMLTATFDVICDVALSGREHFDSETFSKAHHRTISRRQAAPRCWIFWAFRNGFPAPANCWRDRSVRTMHSMVAAAIEARRKHAHRPADDLLDHMLAAQDPETGQRMSAQELIHNMQFFIVAGHETTALALSWALYLLANAPEHQERARAQVARAIERPDRGGRGSCRHASYRADPGRDPCGFIRRSAFWPEPCWRKTNFAAAPCGRTIFCSFPSGRCIATNCCGSGRRNSIRIVSSDYAAQARQISISAVRRGPARLCGRRISP